jgi:FkbM family methyltransferase
MATLVIKRKIARALSRVQDKHLPFVVLSFTISFVCLLLFISVSYLFLTGRIDTIDRMNAETKRKMMIGIDQKKSEVVGFSSDEDADDDENRGGSLFRRSKGTRDGTANERVDVVGRKSDRSIADDEDENHRVRASESMDFVGVVAERRGNTKGFLHPIVRTQEHPIGGFSNCKLRVSAGNSGSIDDNNNNNNNNNGAWDHVPVSSLKQKQKEVFERYALTGFRNKATTDARILMEFLLSITPRPQNGCCAIFDVGANVGKYVEELKSMPIAKDCQIHAFEPNPEVFKIMSRRVATLKSVHLHNAGVAEKPGNLTFYYQPGKADTGGSFMAEHSFEKYADVTGKMKTENVNVITLDDIFDAFVPESVSIPLVKIDVEGLEHRVKTGMSRALASGRVQAVYWERKGALDLEPFETEVKFMSNHGYNVYIMGCSGARKHSCALTLVRVDGPFFDPIFDPKRHRAANQGKFMTMNLLGVKRGHPFNNVVAKKMLAQ